MAANTGTRVRVLALVVAVVAVVAVMVVPATTARQPWPSVRAQDAPCVFQLGFQVIHDAIPEVVGDCLEDERFNPANGNAEQPTTGGLLVWRKADNWTAFTDGYRTWINGPFGLQMRLNTERFEWESEPITPPTPPAPTVPGAAAVVSRIATVLPSNAGRMDWLANPDLIAVSRNDEAGRPQIYVAQGDYRDLQCLTCRSTLVPQESNDQPAWHPSGAWVVFQSVDPALSIPLASAALEQRLTQGGAGLNNNLWVISRDGTRAHQLTRVRSLEATLHPHFSHDGTRLFWTARDLNPNGRDGQWSLKIADFVQDQSGVRLENVRRYQPLGAQAFYESHSFTPDNRKVLFSASPSAVIFDLDIYTLDLITGEVRNLTNSPGVWDEHAQASPSGQKIVWISSTGYPFTPSVAWQTTLRTDFWIMDADGSNKVKLTSFNEPGSPLNTGGRVIAADSTWNGAGDQLVGALAYVGPGGTDRRNTLIQFQGPQ
jgi:Tol biopolymer transport system component